jgi:hypothetical protein
VERDQYVGRTADLDPSSGGIEPVARKKSISRRRKQGCGAASSLLAAANSIPAAREALTIDGEVDPAAPDPMCTGEGSRSDGRGIWIRRRRERIRQPGKRPAWTGGAPSQTGKAIVAEHWFEVPDDDSGPAGGGSDPNGALVRGVPDTEAVSPARKAIPSGHWLEGYGRRSGPTDRESAQGSR